MPRSRPYRIGLNERLKDPDHVAAYLNAAAKESKDVFMLALRDVAEVHKISKVALAAGVNRETLYRTLSARGNPTFTTLESILEAVGIERYYRARLRRKRFAPAVSAAPALQESGALSNVVSGVFLYSGFPCPTGQSAFQRYDFSWTAAPTGPALNPSVVYRHLDAMNPELSSVPSWINDESPRAVLRSVNP